MFQLIFTIIVKTEQGLQSPLSKSQVIIHITIDTEKVTTGNSPTPSREEKEQTTHQNNTFPKPKTGH